LSKQKIKNYKMKRALQILTRKEMINGELACGKQACLPVGRQQLLPLKIKFKQMKRA